MAVIFVRAAFGYQVYLSAAAAGMSLLTLPASWFLIYNNVRDRIGGLPGCWKRATGVFAGGLAWCGLFSLGAQCAASMEGEARRILTELGVDPNIVRQRVETLSGGRQQLVAIARAISFAPALVILDEPTANLSATATEHVLALVQELRGRGVAQILISHRLPDIFAVADRVMVLKRGRNVGERRIRETVEAEVLSLIVQGDAAESTRRD